MSALKLVGVAAAAVTATLVTVNIIQRRRQKKALEEFEKAVDEMTREFFGDYDQAKGL